MELTQHATGKHILPTPCYSLCIFTVQQMFSHLEKEISELLHKGIKIMIFSDKEDKFPALTAFEGELLYYYVHDPVQSEFSIIIDGQFTSSQNKLLILFGMGSKFNYEQYLAEHAPATDDLRIEAGAGAGKTSVMIQRIMFLLHTANIKLREIAMVTFTRDSTTEMRRKLRKELYTRFKLTKQIKYLQMIEDLGDMRISTIDSFAKFLLQELGSAGGFGRNVKIKSYLRERRTIIEDILNEKVKDTLENESLESIFKGIPLYKIIELFEKFWNELENKGIIIQDKATKINWGSSNKNSATLHELIQQVFEACAHRLQEAKEQDNAVSLHDLSHQLELFRKDETSISKLTGQIKYLFIDEFQDTDDTQIGIAAWLRNTIHSRLFVVGDIKQSIYRFRGANYTAFDQLENQLGHKMNGISLKKNYRTSTELLKKMDTFFSMWGKEEILVYQSEDRLIGTKNDIPGTLEIIYLNMKSSDLHFKSEVLSLIEAEQSRLADPKKQRVCVLVRMNFQADLIRQWCEERRIPFQLDIGGTFFKSDCVTEFLHLIEGLLYPDDPKSLANMLSTSYSSHPVHWSTLVQAEGNKTSLLNLLRGISPLEKPEDWKKTIDLLRINPVFSVVREIIQNAQPEKRYANSKLQNLNAAFPEKQEQNEKEAQLQEIEYERGLNLLLELLHQQFDDEFVSLYAIARWLRLQRAVNRDVDQPKVNEQEAEGRVLIKTVHKAKGQEFHTVILPFTDSVFRMKRSELLLEKKADNEWHVGWHIRSGGFNDPTYNNNFYYDMSSIEEIQAKREETRLLYVAMTRVEERLIIVKSKGQSPNWAGLISAGEGG
ncbi:DNA helicase-2 / ATP-dependent DNA helicase PcrA [Paenibacillus sp. GP183]|nr:DNA helicase-2 / ATP-dependent DNA helicase PcrA [Paenibacillus sp. GP183]